MWSAVPIACAMANMVRWPDPRRMEAPLVLLRLYIEERGRTPMPMPSAAMLIVVSTSRPELRRRPPRDDGGPAGDGCPVGVVAAVCIDALLCGLGVA